MLGAMLPAEAQAWFFKLAGPKATVDAVAEQVTKFYSAVKLENGEPSWELPDGWKQSPSSGMRFATLTVPSEGKELELTVIGLPRVGDWAQEAPRQREPLARADETAAGGAGCGDEN